MGLTTTKTVFKAHFHKKNMTEQKVINDFMGEISSGVLAVGSKDAWWYPKPQNQKGKIWITNATTPEELDVVGVIANLCLIECCIAVLPYVLGCIRMCCMDKKDNKSSIAGGISALMAIGTGALGITAVVINSVECLAAMMVMAALFMVSSIFYLLAMLCNLFVTFGCNCLQCLCCKCGDAICDNVCLLFFFILGVAYIVLCFIFDIVLIKSAWGFVFHTAKDAATSAVNNVIDDAVDSISG